MSHWEWRGRGRAPACAAAPAPTAASAAKWSCLSKWTCSGKSGIRVKLGLQISSFTWPGGDAAIGDTLARICRTADDAGFDSIWVMDHLFQIRSVGDVEEPMLEGTTALGFMAAHTQRARLGLMVGAAPYRFPGVWIKSVTTLDVLSGGRAWFGIGAAWNVEESRSLGIPFPDLPDRFALLADTLQMVRQAWGGERGSDASFSGRRTRAGRVL